MKAFVCMLILFSLVGSFFGQTTTPTEKAKASASRYAGSDTTVEVKMLSGSTIKGKILSTSSDSFNLNSDKGQLSTIRYDEVAEIKKKGGLGKGVWIGIAVAAGVAVTLLALKDALFCDGGAAC